MPKTSALIEAEIENLSKTVADVGRLARDLAKKEEGLAPLKNHGAALREAIQQLGAESNAPGRISIASHGFTSTTPSRDRRLAYTLSALAAILIVGIAGWAVSRRLGRRHHDGLLAPGG